MDHEPISVTVETKYQGDEDDPIVTYEARFNGVPEVYVGTDPEGAVGKLVMENRKLFNLDIKVER